jgi:hypothetical protein
VRGPMVPPRCCYPGQKAALAALRLFHKGFEPGHAEAPPGVLARIYHNLLI